MRVTDTSVLLRTITLAALCVLGASACGKSPPATQTPSPAAHDGVPPRLVVLGLDAGTWDLLGPWMDRGLLPNLARLRAGGVYGKLRSTQPSSSPVIWTSIATGKVPEKTGITWFVRFPEGAGKPVPVDRRMRKTKALWNILSDKRIDVAVLGWYVTWPAEQVNGRLLSDIAHFGRAPASASPPEFMWDLKPVADREAIEAMPRFMDFAYDAAKAERKEGQPPTLDYLVYDRFLRAWARDEFYFRAAERTLSDGPLPEAFFLYLRGTDDVQHGFWKFMDPAAFAPRPGPDGKPLAGTTEVPAEQVQAFGKVIENYWKWVDEGVGRVLSHYKTPPLVIVCSDHGAGPAVGEFQIDVPQYLHLSGAHRIDGFFIASGPGIRHDGKTGVEVNGATIYDIAPTILHALGLPLATDLDGRVLKHVFEEPIADRADQTIATYDTAPAAPEAAPELPADIDQKMIEHMKSLGYIQ